MAIQVEMEALIVNHNRFGWDRLNPAIRKTVRSNWVEALQRFSIEDIQAACRRYTLENPDGNPNEGHIYRLILKERERRARLNA